MSAAVFGDVTSANVVGYQNQTMKYSTGYNFIIPTFVDVASGDATYDLQNIKLVDAAGDLATDVIIGYNENAALSDIDYYWGTPDGSIFFELEKEGWYDCDWQTAMDRGSDPVLVENVVITNGCGLWLALGSDGAVVQYAGQVYAAQRTTPELIVGYNMVGNSTPVEIDLQDMKLVDAAGDLATDVIIGYNENAALSDIDYYWGTPDGSIFFELEKEGWYDCDWQTAMDRGSDPVLVTGVKLLPGQGLYLAIGTEGAKLQLPDPMAAKK